MTNSHDPIEPTESQPMTAGEVLGAIGLTVTMPIWATALGVAALAKGIYSLVVPGKKDE